jgi:hypothetical protein
MFGQDNSKSPTKAMLFSIIPGGGQVYNEDYWKAPIMFGAAGVVLTSALYYDGLFKDSEKLIENETDKTSNYVSQLKRRKEYYRDYRDQFYLYLGAIYVVSLLDAYTGAYLYNFDINEDTSFNIGITKRNQVGINLTIKLD